MAEVAAKRTLDFTNVKDGGGISPKRKPAGEYLATVTGVTEAKSKAGNDMWVFTLKLKVDPTAVYAYYLTLNEESLWKVRNFLISCGAAIPKKRIGIDPSKFVGRDVGVILEDDEYEGKAKSNVSGTIPKGELASAAPVADDDDEEDETEEEEETPAPVKKAVAKKPAAKKAQEPEPEDEEFEELDLDDL